MLDDEDVAGNRREGTETPGKRQYRRRHAKADDVGEGVEFKSEVAGCVRQAGNPAVKPIENTTDADSNSSVVEVPFERRNDGIAAAENIADREQAGNDRQTALEMRPRRNPSFFNPAFDHLGLLYPSDHGRSTLNSGSD